LNMNTRTLPKLLSLNTIRIILDIEGAAILKSVKNCSALILKAGNI